MSSLRRTALLVLALLTFLAGPVIAASAPAVAADPVGTLTIHLRDAAGHPIPNNHLLAQPDAAGWAYQPWTDAQGDAVLQVRPASYTVWSSEPYPGGPTTPVAVAAGESVEITLTTPRNYYEFWSTPGISGTGQVGLPLTGHRGGWVDQGASVTWQWNRGGTPIAGATGSSYTPVPENQSLPITLTVTGPVNGVPTTRTSPPVTITAATQGRIAGQIRFAGTEEPVGNVWVVICRPGPGAWGCQDGTAQGVNTDAQGVIDRLLTPGDYKVWIRGNNSGASEEWWTASGGTPDHNLAQTVTVTAGHTSDLGTVELERLGRVSVTVTDDQGTPVDDVDFYLMGQWRGYQGHPPNNGTFDAAAVEPGTYSLSVEPSVASGLRSHARSVEVAPGADIHLDVVLYANAFTGTPTAAIEGVAQVGKVLDATSEGWSDAPASFDHQWLRDGQPIQGATHAEYIPVAGDIGSELSVRITGRKPGYEPLTVTSPALAVGAGVLANTDTAIGGNAAVGSVLTADPYGWDDGVAFTYQWLRDGQPISGADGATYLLTVADLSTTISLQVTGSREGYESRTVDVPGLPMSKGTLALTPRPTIAGTTKVGKTLRAAAGTWDDGVQLSYRWFRNGKAIRGATAKKYVLTRKDRGTRLTVVVTGRKPGYSTVARVSAPTRRIS